METWDAMDLDRILEAAGFAGRSGGVRWRAGAGAVN
jgi:hypothetical protein